MPSNEGWDSVFLQALQNSLAQSKAETKWNQELAFRDKEFEQKKTEFDWTKAYNEKQLEMARQTNLVDFNSKFRKLEGQDLNNWNNIFAGMYGAGVDNPYTTDVVESNYVPWAALQAKDTTVANEKTRLDNLALNYSPNLQPFGYAGAQSAAKIGAVDASAFDMALAKKLGLNVPTGTLYRNAAGDSAAKIQEGWDTNQANNAAAASRMWMQIAAEDRREENRQRGSYVVVTKDGKKNYEVGLTPTEIGKKYGKDVLYQRIDDREAFSGSLYQRDQGKYNIDNKQSEAAIYNLLEEMVKAGIDPSALPEFRVAATNKLEDIARRNYSVNPQSSPWGEFVKGMVPNSWTEYDYNEAVNKGLITDDYYRALNVLRGIPQLGANPQTILKGN